MQLYNEIIGAYHHDQDGKRWFRIVTDTGYDFDEPIAGWSMVMDLEQGRLYYVHKDGRRVYCKTH